MLSKIFWTIVAPFAVLTQAAAQAPIDGYGVVDIQFDMPIDPTNLTGKFVTVTGTIQQAIAKMDTDHPGWNHTFVTTLNQRKSAATPLPARDTLPGQPLSYNCYGRWKTCSWSAIAWGIDYLRKLPEEPRPRNGPGPGNCGKVSCSYKSAIWWCNDNAAEYSVTWPLIADGATWLNGEWGNPATDKGHCTQESGVTFWTGGQAFYPGNWNVIVNADTC